jgi:glycosyltransferase involved in cell wall biosynthesis
MKLLITTQSVDMHDPILGFFHGWIEEFAKHFTEVHVICLQEGKHTLPPHVFVYSLGKESGESRLKYTFRFYKFFAKIFFGVRVDYVFFHMGAIYNIMAAPFFLVRTILETQFYWWKAHGHINALGRLALVFVDRVYTSTESGFRVDTKKRRVIGQAIDAKKFQFPSGTTSRSEEGIFVGRITPIKRIQDLIEVAAILKEGHPHLTWSIVGPVHDAPYYGSLKELCVAKGVADRVIFVGTKTQTELATLYARARVFLNPSRTESMDKTVLESVLCGCIPVTGNTAFKDLLKDDGLYIEDATCEAYAKKIAEVLDGDNKVLQLKLRDRVAQEHSIDTFTHRIFRHD